MLCWEIREVTTDRQGKARLGRNSSQTKELGQDAAGNRAMEESRAGCHSKCLLSTNNVVGTIICYGAQRWMMDIDMNLALMTLHFNPSYPMCCDMDIKEQSL